MTALLAWLSARNKALATLAIGVQGWGLFVVHSTSKAITSDEWMLLAGVGIATVFTHQIANTIPAPQQPVPMRDVTPGP